MRWVLTACTTLINAFANDKQAAQSKKQKLKAKCMDFVLVATFAHLYDELTLLVCGMHDSKPATNASSGRPMAHAAGCLTPATYIVPNNASILPVHTIVATAPCHYSRARVECRAVCRHFCIFIPKEKTHQKNRIGRIL